VAGSFIPFRRIAISNIGSSGAATDVAGRLLAWVERATQRNGADAILIRENWEPVLFQDMVYRLNRHYAVRDFSILINTQYDPSWPVEGFHFKENTTIDPAVVSKKFAVGKSVHSVVAAKAAERAGFHYVFFSPVFETLSHPGQRGQGLAKLQEACTELSIPVFALGGINPENEPACRQHGAYGVVGLGMFRG
jgi:thiamine-phosphate pyrophosphorylase